jgi:protein phosphatase
MVRQINQDSVMANGTLFAVADGMGGHDGGEIASDIVVKFVSQAVFDGVALTDAINAAHHAILTAVDNGIGYKGMGATCIALQISEAEYTVAWAGDSRAYHWNGSSLNQITQDHTLVQLMVNKGVLSQEQAKRHPHRHIHSKVAGAAVNNIRSECVTGQLDETSQILLCSDGLTNEIKDIDIARIMAENNSEQKKVDRLIDLSLRNGGNDNITAIIVSGTDREE